MPKRILTAWLPQKRPVGRPELTYGHTVVRTVRAVEEAGGGFVARQLKTKAKKNIGLVFLQKKQEHGEAGTAKQGTEQSL
jgi:hypothetical protein